MAGTKSLGPLRLAELTSPANPSSGERLLYPKSDGKWYSKDSAGVETEVGAAPSNMVTTDTAQTITGSKTFTAGPTVPTLLANTELRVGPDAYGPATAILKYSNDRLVVDTWGGAKPVSVGGSVLYLATESDVTTPISTPATTKTNVIVKGIASQTADLQQWQDSTGAVKAKVTPGGEMHTSGLNLTGKLTSDYTATLGGNSGDYVEVEVQTHQGDINAFRRMLWMQRRAAGTDWVTAQLYDGIGIDVSFLTPTTAKTYWRRSPNENLQAFGTDGTDHLILTPTLATLSVPLTVATINLTNALAQAKTHANPDTDSASTALHHTLGTGANQAAAGNHTHPGAAVQPSAPSSPSAGDFWFDDDDTSVTYVDAIRNTLLDAKGDLVAGTANDTAGRLGVGADGTALLADSSQATGLRWGTHGSATELAATTDYASTMPSAPSTGVKLFARNRARRLPSFVGPLGQDSQLQPAFFSNRVAWMQAINNSATPSLNGLAVTHLSNGAASAVAVLMATTNFYSSMIRHRYNTASTSGTGAGVRVPTAQWFFSSTANLGGFFMVTRFGLNSGNTNTRGFIGLSATTAALAAGTNPSALLNQIGFGWDTGRTTMQFMYNDGAGTSTMVDMGASFPTSASFGTYFYEARLFAPSGAGQSVYYSLHRLNDGVVVAGGPITTDLPAVNTLLTPHVHYSNGTNAVQYAIDVQSLYIETDN